MINKKKQKFKKPLPKVEVKLDITLQDIIKILNDYYKFIGKGGYDANSACTYVEYIEFLKR